MLLSVAANPWAASAGIFCSWDSGVTLTSTVFLLERSCRLSVPAFASTDLTMAENWAESAMTEIPQMSDIAATA